MARVVYHEHPGQSGGCLPGAFASYVDRIPLDGFADVDEVWQAVRSRPFELDLGKTWGRCAMSPCPLPREASQASDARCAPAQRSRVWPDRMNCWEATAHFVAAAQRLLGDEWTVHVWDRDLPNGARHVWPSLVSPTGDHYLADLQTQPLKEYPQRGYSAVALPRAAANDSTQQYTDLALNIAGGIGGVVAGVFGGPEAGGMVSKGVGGIRDIVDDQAFGQDGKQKPPPQEPKSSAPPDEDTWAARKNQQPKKKRHRFFDDQDPG